MRARTIFTISSISSTNEPSFSSGTSSAKARKDSMGLNGGALAAGTSPTVAISLDASALVSAGIDGSSSVPSAGLDGSSSVPSAGFDTSCTVVPSAGINTSSSVPSAFLARCKGTCESFSFVICALRIFGSSFTTCDLRIFGRCRSGVVCAFHELENFRGLLDGFDDTDEVCDRIDRRAAVEPFSQCAEAVFTGPSSDPPINMPIRLSRAFSGSHCAVLVGGCTCAGDQPDVSLCVFRVGDCRLRQTHGFFFFLHRNIFFPMS